MYKYDAEVILQVLGLIRLEAIAFGLEAIAIRWRPSLLGLRPSLLGWRPSAIAIRIIRLEA